LAIATFSIVLALVIFLSGGIYQFPLAPGQRHTSC
jgi:hypothetical protein